MNKEHNENNNNTEHLRAGNADLILEQGVALYGFDPVTQDLSIYNDKFDEQLVISVIIVDNFSRSVNMFQP